MPPVACAEHDSDLILQRCDGSLKPNLALCLSLKQFGATPTLGPCDRVEHGGTRLGLSRVASPLRRDVTEATDDPSGGHLVLASPERDTPPALIGREMIVRRVQIPGVVADTRERTLHDKRRAHLERLAQRVLPDRQGCEGLEVA